MLLYEIFIVTDRLYATFYRLQLPKVEVTEVASVAIGANYKQCVEAFAEAEKYETRLFQKRKDESKESNFQLVQLQFLQILEFAVGFASRGHISCHVSPHRRFQQLHVLHMSCNLSSGRTSTPDVLRPLH